MKISQWKWTDRLPWNWMKAHYVINLHYDWRHESIYKYLQQYVYDMPDKSGIKEVALLLMYLHTKIEKVVL